MKIKYTTISLFLILFLSSCEKWFWQHDKLHLEKRNYNGTELRIDGYYFQEYGGEEKYLDIVFFYRNGVVLDVASTKESISENEINFRLESCCTNIKEHRWNWGVFNIDSNVIKYERWYPYDLVDKAFVNEGYILNDTTFIITKRYRIKRDVEKELRILNDTFHFKELSPKPDSTNNFIK